MDSNVLDKLKEVQEWLVKEYAGIRTGQASPMLLDSIKNITIHIYILITTIITPFWGYFKQVM